MRRGARAGGGRAAQCADRGSPGWVQATPAPAPHRPPAAHGGQGPQQGEQHPGEHHPVVLVVGTGERHEDEGDASDDVADVEEEEATEEREAEGLLAGPQDPLGGVEVPHGVHIR